ncbi:MAG TPA: NAD-dependent epimerase/dehydratase family protein [Pyrinomonadaceae bacterium]|nr:NAD-dependent epimerase/dehydratase family protein [Pyrinomonadaceae bacterium]
MSISFEKYKGRSVLITGGLGFVGSNLARRLAEIGDVDLTIIDSLSEDQGGNLYNIEDFKDRVKLHVADVGDSWVINHLVGGVDYIFNLAGSVSHIDSMRLPQRDLQLNCAIHLTLLEACRMFNPHVKIVFTSTRQVYGKPAYLPIDEQHRVQPMDINGINKYAAEMYHLLYQRAYGLRTVSLRLTNTYGPRQQMHHNRQGFIAWFIRQAIDGETIQLFGDGRQSRDMNYIDDVVDALLLAGLSEEAEGEIFNLGHHQIVSLAEIAGKLINLTGRGAIVGVAFPPERQLTDVGNCNCSYKKIEQILGWRPQVDLDEGLKRTIEFYQRNRDRYWNAADENSNSKTFSALRRVK